MLHKLIFICQAKYCQKYYFFYTRLSCNIVGNDVKVMCGNSQIFQLQYGQKNVDSTGLADGEGTERLWSYLRTMSKITKEMSLDNRHDMLVDSLHHYSTKLQMSLGMVMLLMIFKLQD